MFLLRTEQSIHLMNSHRVFSLWDIELFISFMNLWSKNFSNRTLHFLLFPHTFARSKSWYRTLSQMGNCKSISQFLSSFLILEASFSYIVLVNSGSQGRKRKIEEYPRIHEFTRAWVFCCDRLNILLLPRQGPGEPREKSQSRKR